MAPVAKTKEIHSEFTEGTLGDEDFEWGLEKMVALRLAWQRAVAKAWALDDFRDRLLNPKTAHAALQEVGWDVPGGLEIEIRRGSGIEWDKTIAESKIIDKKTGKEVAANGWAYELDAKGHAVYRRAKMLHALRTKVTMTLPPEPPKDSAEFAPLALADYDGLQRAYPFTTCTCC